MGEYQEKARALRPIIEKAVATGELTDDQREAATNLFPAWDSSGHAYMINDYVQHEGLLYRCVQSHTSQVGWGPTAAASLWSRAGNPTEEWPEWIQPTGAHDAYAQGDKVSHNGKHWVSNVDGNVWQPPTQWTEAE